MRKSFNQIFFLFQHEVDTCRYLNFLAEHRTLILILHFIDPQQKKSKLTDFLEPNNNKISLNFPPFLSHFLWTKCEGGLLRQFFGSSRLWSVWSEKRRVESFIAHTVKAARSSGDESSENPRLWCWMFCHFHPFFSSFSHRERVHPPTQSSSSFARAPPHSLPLQRDQSVSRFVLL